MKIKELKTLSAEELSKELLALLREQFKLRMQKGTGQLTKFSQLKTVRRAIARVKTLLTERKLSGNQ